MATVTRIKTTSANYCRYDEKCKVVEAVLYITGAAPGAVVSADLVRLDGYGKVLTKSVTLAGTETNVRLLFPLEECTDPNYTHIYRARSGQYAVVSGAVKSPAFSVSLVSVRRFRDELCRGLPLLTGETVGVQDQPKLVAGVTILQIAPDLPQDVYVLDYHHTDQSISWDGGARVLVGAGGEFALIDSNQKWWVRVSVEDTLLPATDQTESLVVTEERMSDGQILAAILQAQSQVEDYIQVYLEPTQVATQVLADFLHTPPSNFSMTKPTNDFQDTFRQPVDYIRADNMSDWMSIKLPVRCLIELEALMGFMNSTQSVELDSNWWLWDEKSALVRLVPTNNAAINWSNYTGFFYTFIMAGYASLPNFWHWKGTCGLRALRGREATVLTMLEYTAAINVLRDASLHSKPGYSQETTARDGLAQTLSYTTGPGGVYALTIQQYEKWLAENSSSIKRNRKGLQVAFFR